MPPKSQKARMQAQLRCSPAMNAILARALEDAGELPPAAQERVCEDLRLQFDYAGEYVAYIDRFCIHKGVRHFVREVLAHNRSLKELHDAVADLPAAKRAKIIIHYATDPHRRELEVHYDLAYRE